MALVEKIKDYTTSFKSAGSDFKEFASYCLESLGFTYEYVSISKSEKVDRTEKLECLETLADDMNGLVDDFQELSRSVKLRMKVFKKHLEELSKVSPAVFDQLNESTSESDNEIEENFVGIAASSPPVESSTNEPREAIRNNLADTPRFEATGHPSEDIAIVKPSVTIEKALEIANLTTFDGIKPQSPVISYREVRFHKYDIVECLKSIWYFVMRNWFFFVFSMLCMTCICVQHAMLLHVLSATRGDRPPHNLCPSLEIIPFNATCSLC